MSTLFELADFEPKPVYQGRAPLHFTTDYFHPDELEEATQWLRNEEGFSFGSAVGRIHTWRYGVSTGWCVPETAEHSLCLLTCSLECFGVGHRHDAIPIEEREAARLAGYPIRWACQDVQATLVQAVCSKCEWHVIADSYHGESNVVEAWHDHAFPGWRDLPVVPYGLQGEGSERNDKRIKAWVVKHYPAEWQREYAPVLTERKGYGTRHVPGGSPWGGFDLCAQKVEGAS